MVAITPRFVLNAMQSMCGRRFAMACALKRGFEWRGSTKDLCRLCLTERMYALRFPKSERIFLGVGKPVALHAGPLCSVVSRMAF
jgi:hypothetical protein